MKDSEAAKMVIQYLAAIAPTKGVQTFLPFSKENFFKKSKSKKTYLSSLFYL